MKAVLIVDDEKEFLLSLQAGLRAYADRFEVLTAANGAEALQVLKRRPVDLVVTDLRMPVMDGLELLTRMGLEHPGVPLIVMSAYATAETERILEEMGGPRLLEKPVDLNLLAEAIQDGLIAEFKGGSVAGISLGNFLQLLEMEEKTCLLEVQADSGHKGCFYFNGGELWDAVLGNQRGEEAALAMLALHTVDMTIKKPPAQKIRRRIHTAIMSLVMEGSRRQDESAGAESPDALPDGTPPDLDEEEDEEESEAAIRPQSLEAGAVPAADACPHHRKGAFPMSAINSILERFRDVTGFEAVGVFSPSGEMAAALNNGGLKLEELGALANDVLLKAQKATEIMGVGRGNMVHIQAPRAQVVARCLNESTDFATTQSGRAHIHVVLVLGQEGNLAMGKMKLDAAIQELATHFR